MLLVNENNNASYQFGLCKHVVRYLLLGFKTWHKCPFFPLGYIIKHTYIHFLRHKPFPEGLVNVGLFILYLLVLILLNYSFPPCHNKLIHKYLFQILCPKDTIVFQCSKIKPESLYTNMSTLSFKSDISHFLLYLLYK